MLTTLDDVGFFCFVLQIADVALVAGRVPTRVAHDAVAGRRPRRRQVAVVARLFDAGGGSGASVADARRRR